MPARLAMPQHFGNSVSYAESIACKRAAAFAEIIWCLWLSRRVSRGGEAENSRELPPERRMRRQVQWQVTSNIEMQNIYAAGANQQVSYLYANIA